MAAYEGYGRTNEAASRVSAYVGSASSDRDARGDARATRSYTAAALPALSGSQQRLPRASAVTTNSDGQLEMGYVPSVARVRQDSDVWGELRRRKRLEKQEREERRDSQIDALTRQLQALTNIVQAHVMQRNSPRRGSHAPTSARSSDGQQSTAEQSYSLPEHGAGVTLNRSNPMATTPMEGHEDRPFSTPSDVPRQMDVFKCTASAKPLQPAALFAPVAVASATTPKNDSEASYRSAFVPIPNAPRPSDDSSDGSPVPRKSRRQREASEERMRRLRAQLCPKPEMFSGKAADLLAWLSKFELYAATTQLPDRERPSIASLFMTPSTLQALGLNAADPLPASWEAMKLHLRNHFFGADPSLRLYEEVSRTTQRRGETIEAYAVRLGDLVRLTNQDEIIVPPAAAIALFISGLADEYTRRTLERERALDRERVAQGLLPRLADYQACVREARRAESRPTDPPPGRSNDSRKPAEWVAKATPTEDRSARRDRPNRANAADAPAKERQHTASPKKKPQIEQASINAVMASRLDQIQATLAEVAKARMLPARRSPGRSSPRRSPRRHRSRERKKPPGHAKLRCFNCNKSGHVMGECSEPRNQRAIQKNRDEWLAERKARTPALETSSPKRQASKSASKERVSPGNRPAQTHDRKPSLN